MRLNFSKYQGTGNDFIIIDNRGKGWNLEEPQIARLCDRHFGIGADGLMLLRQQEGYDFSMSYFNSDGRESSMCGNGGRCITAYAHHLGLIQKRARFHAIDGEHIAEILTIDDEGFRIRLKMKDTFIYSDSEDGIFVNTGSPHFVKFVENLEILDVVAQGKAIRNDDSFAPDGTNVDFVEVGAEGLFVRSYERGVENETLSCGTGVTASALATAFISGENVNRYLVRTRGGKLTITFQQDGMSFRDIWLEGAARFVFSGTAAIA
jgi:diaminopimelate epimerase